jgi:hypothetical protein
MQQVNVTVARCCLEIRLWLRHELSSWCKSASLSRGPERCHLFTAHFTATWRIVYEVIVSPCESKQRKLPFIMYNWNVGQASDSGCTIYCSSKSVSVCRVRFVTVTDFTSFFVSTCHEAFVTSAVNGGEWPASCPVFKLLGGRNIWRCRKSGADRAVV